MHRVIIVCGGRDYTDRKKLYTCMGEFHKVHRLELVFTGGAQGADTLAAEWCLANHVDVRTMNAHWEHGKGAGHARNHEMLAMAQKYGCMALMAFPGGTGTNHMIQISLGKLEIYRRDER